MTRFLVGLAAIFCITLALAARAFGVPTGTPVVDRFNSSNNVNAAVEQAAQQLNLGPVKLTHYQPNCLPKTGWVVVCRDPSLKNGATRTTATDTSCVVALDPKLGNGPRSSNIYDALAKCLTAPTATPVNGTPSQTG